MDSSGYMLRSAAMRGILFIPTNQLHVQKADFLAVFCNFFSSFLQAFGLFFVGFGLILAILEF